MSIRQTEKDTTLYSEKPAVFHAFLLLLLLGLATFSQAQQEGAADPLEQVKYDAAELVNSVGFYTNTQKDQLLTEADAVIAQLDKRMHALQSRIESDWDSMSASARSEARETMDALRAQRVEVAEWYGSLKSSSDAAWEQAKDGFAQAYGALIDAWQDAEAEFTTGG